VLGFARLFIVICGLFTIAFGLILAFVVEPPVPLFGLFIALIGLGIIGVLAVERMRYRSERAEELRRAPRSPGGDGPGVPLDPRFRATDERFVDPSSGVLMRVYVDPASGERRYRSDSGS
jgi:hypothetical protein